MSELFRRDRLVALISFFLAFAWSGDLLAQARPTRTHLDGEAPRWILWAGHSFFYYNNSMHNHVGAMARASEPKMNLRGTSVTISGAGLDWHDMESYFRPNGIGKYSIIAGNEVRFNQLDKLFDAVIMSDCSQCPIHPKLKPVFHEYAKTQSDIVRSHGAAPILFMTWAYKDKPEMTAQLAEEYTVAGNANDALVIPAGLAFAKAIAARSDLEFYQRDKRHPTLIGTYLSAATAYAAIYGKSPVGNQYTAGIDAETVRFLQTVAWETVQEYYGR